MIRHSLCFVLLSLSLRPALTEAQVIPGPRPTASECRAAAGALAAGARDGTGWESLPGCGKLGAEALAQAFSAARSETDAAYLERLYGATKTLRDPEVFATSLAVMLDQGASPQARATAISGSRGPA
jgi:hypothetical protein